MKSFNEKERNLKDDLEKVRDFQDKEELMQLVHIICKRSANLAKWSLFKIKRK